jgi:peroxiredoxin
MSATSKKSVFALFLGILSTLLSAQTRKMRTCTECDTIFSLKPMAANQLFEANNATFQFDSLQNVQAIEVCASTESRKLRFEGLVQSERFPPFSFLDLNQKEIRLPDLEGKVVYIEFWATWSPPSVQHLQKMQHRIQANSDSTIVYLFVSVDRDAQRWRNYVTQNQFGGFHVLDQHQLIAMYCNIQAIPNYFLIDKKGKIALNSVLESNFDSKWNAL